MVRVDVERREPIVAYRSSQKEIIPKSQIGRGVQGIDAIVPVYRDIGFVEDIILVIIPGTEKGPSRPIAGTGHGPDALHITDIVLLVTARVKGKGPFLSELLVHPHH